MMSFNKTTTINSKVAYKEHPKCTYLLQDISLECGARTKDKMMKGCLNETSIAQLQIFVVLCHSAHLNRILF